MEYPTLPSTVDCGGIVGFILTLKGQVFSLILYKWWLLFSLQSVLYKLDSPMPGYVTNIERETQNNDDFRHVLFTADHV